MRWFLILIFIGVFLWLANLHIVSLARDWPVILIVIGLLNLFDIFKKGKKSRILNDLDSGKISVEEAEDKLKKS
jgi:hypothetical protein